MNIKTAIATLAFLAAPATASAVEYLTEVTSDVQPAPGMSTDQIISRAQQCIKSASKNDARAVDASIDGDTVYAVVETSYMLAFMVPDFVRSRLSVIAKEERFKIVHTDIEHNDLNPFNGKPLRVHTQFGGGAKQIEAALAERSSDVATCITKQETAGGDW